MNRSEFSASDRRVLVAELYLKGKFQSQIAAQVGVTQQQVSADLKTVRAAWLQAGIRDFDAIKSEQLAKLDHLETVAWDAWERSKTDAVKQTTKRKSEPAKDNQPSVVSDEAGIIREAQVGDDRFLARVESVIDKRCKIFGLYAPTKLDINDLDSLLARELARVSGVQGLESIEPASVLPQ